MQMEQAKRKRAAWGDKPCDHPHLDKEYYRGAQTGDYACLQCGASFMYDEMDAMRKKRAELERNTPKK
jgi:hypothetical protein